MAENTAPAEGENDATQSSNNVDVVQLNWMFLDTSGGLCPTFPLSVPRELYEGFSYKCRELIVEEALNQHGIETDIKLISLWKPKAPLKSSEAGKRGWATSITDFDEAFEVITFNISLSNALDSRVTEAEQVHLVVTIGPEEKSSDTVVDIPASRFTPEYRDYKGVLEETGMTPSAGATPDAYLKIQKSHSIHDGLGPSGRGPTNAPIGLFHPVFSEFEYLINDPRTQPSAELIRDVKCLMTEMSYLRPEADVYEKEVRTRLRNLVSGPSKETLEYDWQTSKDFVTYLPARVNFLVTELSASLGNGGIDPSIKAGLTMKYVWSNKSQTAIREKCCCPTFILVTAGPWLCIMGAILTRRLVVQRLTDMQWMCISSTQGDMSVYRIARVFLALQICVAQLETFYKNLADGKESIATLLPNVPHPRFYPHTTFFRTEDGATVNFEYQSISRYSNDRTYVIKYNEGMVTAVVKFVSRYGKDAHDFLARKGRAPKIIYYGPIPNIRLPRPPAVTDEVKSLGLSLHSNLTHMVVMEYIPELVISKPKDALHRLRGVIFMLHAEGYVFGNLAEDNILFDKEGSLWLTSFDWSGRFDVTAKNYILPMDLQSQIDLLADRDDIKKAINIRYPIDILKGDRSFLKGRNYLDPISPVYEWTIITRLDWKNHYSG